MEIADCVEAEDSGEATVTWLEDVVIAEEQHEGLDDVTVEVGGETLTIPGAPSIVVPERVGQAGCIIEYDAPGGCLPAVEISPAYTPGFTLPSRSIPEVDLPDGTVLPEVTQNEIQVSAVEEPGIRQEEACQSDESELDGGDYVPLAHRPIAVRSITVQGIETSQFRLVPFTKQEMGLCLKWCCPKS